MVEAFKLEIENILGLEIYYSPGGYGLQTSDRSLTILNPFIDETYELKIIEQRVILQITTRRTTGNFSYDLFDPKCIVMIISKLKELCDPYCEFKK